MRAIVPDSIAARTMIVLLVGLTLSHIASTWVLSSDRHAAVFEASERLCADRVASWTVLAGAGFLPPVADESAVERRAE